jgi:hypothetical protein
MTKRNPGKPSLEKELDALLTKLCIEWGFCIPPADFRRIATSRRLSADEFADEVLRAEGFDPEYELHWFRKIKRRFIDQFGECISADDY